MSSKVSTSPWTGHRTNHLPTQYIPCYAMFTPTSELNRLSAITIKTFKYARQIQSWTYIEDMS
jgi:hypothetical protein